MLYRRYKNLLQCPLDMIVESTLARKDPNRLYDYMSLILHIVLSMCADRPAGMCKFDSRPKTDKYLVVMSDVPILTLTRYTMNAIMSTHV